ncbi:hypothetical protein LLH00_00545 [bacterium]|nr:hypothetical protein [bacterium]
MDCRIVLWDSDRSLREALFSRLLRKGFYPVSLGDPSKLDKAVRMLAPELVLFEATWERGETVSLGGGGAVPVQDGDLSLVLPLAAGSSGTASGARGLVLERLRKPFGTRELLGGISSALAVRERLNRHCRPGREWLEVKRLSDDSEIEAALRLRQEVYRETGFIQAGALPLEYDHYDRNSIHFGAFHVQGAQRELAGTIRIIRRGTEGTPTCSEAVERVVRRYEPSWCESAASEVCPELPALKTFGLGAGELEVFLPGFGGRESACGRRAGGEVCELSRLAIARPWRLSRFGIERMLFQMIVVDSMAGNPRRNWFVIAVHPSRQAKFERFGFRVLDQLGVRPYAGLNQPAILLSLDLQHYLTTPNPFSASLELELLLYRAAGYLSHAVAEENEQKGRVAAGQTV